MESKSPLKYIVFSLSCISLLPCDYAYAQKPQKYTFTGAVANDEHYVHEIEPGLYFHLEPGWRMTVNATEKQNSNDDYIYPVSPPYRFNPTQYFDGSYGDDPLKNSKRCFYFILKPDDYKTASNTIPNILWSQNEQEYQQALTTIDELPTGVGLFTIISGKDKSFEAKDGIIGKSITQMTFSVNLQIPTTTDCNCDQLQLRCLETTK